jgi:hypothetical protein
MTKWFSRTVIVVAVICAFAISQVVRAEGDTGGAKKGKGGAAGAGAAGGGKMAQWYNSLPDCCKETVNTIKGGGTYTGDKECCKATAAKVTDLMSKRGGAAAGGHAKKPEGGGESGGGASTGGDAGATTPATGSTTPAEGSKAAE